MLGSISSVQDKPTVFTSYKFTLNKYKIYEEAFKECLATYICSQNFVDEAKIRNDIHNNIWNNQSLWKDEQERDEEAFSSAYMSNKSELYEYYHHYFTDKVKDYVYPKKRDHLFV